MKRIVISLILLVSSTWIFAQDCAITTFILVRHAEKDLTQSTNDPELSSEGKIRATKLVNALRQTSIDAIYSTDFKRTRNTVEPIATSRSLPVITYNAMIKEDVDVMLSKYRGGTVLVCGHSNTIPQFANYLIGQEQYRPFEDNEYGNIIIVSLTERGKDAKVVWLSF